jgi:hypothetical protein
MISKYACRGAGIYSFCTGDISDPKVKAGKEGAFQKSVAFFKTHL